MMKNYTASLLFVFVYAILFGANKSSAQIPTTCFEIQSILVDACGNPEGENEMVRFITGPAPLNVSALTITWGSANLFLGMCQNTQTDSVVTALNATIQQCGFIKQPTGGVLPAASTVILATSTNMNPAFNSFANLSDTIYMIFQCSGNTAGHFKNYQSGAGARNLLMTFAGACSDSVTYIVDSLTDQTGNHTGQDGASVYFDFPGSATYVNNGCVAPVGYNVSVSANPLVVCAGDLVNVSAVISNGYNISHFWFGGNGTYGNSLLLNTTYQTDNIFTGTDYLYLATVNACHDTLVDTISIQINSGSSVNITTGTIPFCQGDSALLTATGGSNYNWSTGATTASIYVYNAGTYSVTSNSSCGTATDSVAVTVFPLPNAPAITQSGDTLFSSGSFSGYQWYFGSVAIAGATNSSYVATQSGNYNLIVTDDNGCKVGAGILNVIAGTNEFNVLSSMFNIFPNPNNGVFVIQSSESAIQEITISNLPGEIIYSTTVNSKLKTINSNLSAGIYFVQVTIGERKLVKKLFVE